MILSRALIVFVAALSAATATAVAVSAQEDTFVTAFDGEGNGGRDDEGADWGKELSAGQFVLRRNEVRVPETRQIFYHCLGGTGYTKTRLVVSSPDVTYDEIAFDTSTWEDPINDWNATLNNNIDQRTKLIEYGSIIGGYLCRCTYFQLNFYEWLKSNKAAGSTMAYDFWQAEYNPPWNWHNTGYLEPGQGYKKFQVYDGGMKLASIAEGWHPVTALSVQSSESVATTSKRLRIDDGGAPFVLRAMSKNDAGTDYELVVYLIEEDPDPILPEDAYVSVSISEGSRRSPRVYPPRLPSGVERKMFTSQSSDPTKVTAMTFGPAPEGYYYAITVWNEGEDTQVDTDGEPPFECRPGDNGLDTRYEVTYTFASCEEVVCNGDVIEVVASSESSNDHSAAGHLGPWHVVTLLASYVLFGTF